MPNDIPDRIFRKLQHVYPREFREEYADEMIVTFEERAREARARGRGALIRFWVSVLMDVIATAAREHSDGWIQDISRAGRSLARNRSLTIVATLSLAIGIGATMTVFSVIDSVLLRSLPFPASDRLFVLTEESGHGISFFNYLEVQQRSRTFRSLAAFSYPNTPPTYTGGEVPLVLDGVLATSTLFDVLGTAPEVGRVFTPEEDRAGVAPVIVLGHAFWAREMGADPSVIGTGITLDGIINRIVGVMPQGFQYPSAVDYWKPLQAEVEPPGRRALGFLSLVGRRRMYVLVAADGNPLDLVPAIRERVGAVDPLIAVQDVQLIEDLLEGSVAGPRFRATLMMLFAVVAVILALVGIYGMLSRLVVLTRHEIGVRIAMGAPPSSVLRYVVGRGLRTTVLGLILGVLGALATSRLFAAMLVDVSATSPANLALTALLFIAVVLAASYFPARRASRLDPVETLRS